MGEICITNVQFKGERGHSTKSHANELKQGQTDLNVTETKLEDMRKESTNKK